MGTEKPPLIFAFGFDAAGFPITTADKESAGQGDGIRYVKYNESLSLADADGVIFLSGIFEKERESIDFAERRHVWFEYDEHQLALREKQIFQLLKKGGWVGVLLRRVVNGR